MVFLASLLIGATLPLQSAPQEPAPAQQDLLVVHVSGLSRVLVDPKDAQLRNALSMLGPRLRELPAELGDTGAMPASLLPFLGRLGSRPFDLRVGVAPEAEMPFYAQLNLHEPTGEAALGASTEFERALATFGVEPGPADERGLRELPAPFPAWFGPSGTDFVLAVGDLSFDPPELDPGHLPEGVPVSMAMQLDIGGLIEVLEAFGLITDELQPMLAIYEFLGITHARVNLAMGSDAERSYAVTALEGVVPDMRASGMLPVEPISRASLEAIPADAVWAAVGVNNLEGGMEMLRAMLGSVDQLGGASMGDPFEALMEATGIDIERDLLAHLGSSLGIYASDSTGGGGLSSMILFAEVADARALSESSMRIEGMLNEMAAAESDGYAQIRVRTIDGVRFSSLTFPGLPIPVQPTWTIASGFFLMGMTSEAVQAALQQVKATEHGLIDEPRFQEQIPEGVEDLYGLSYVDTGRLMRDGYGWSSLACSALANALRSREDAAREPGSLLPSYHALSEGAKSWVTVSRVVGDDLVETARMDRSLLVNATALAGLLDSMPVLMLVGGMAAWTMPRMVSEQMVTASLEAPPAPAPVGMTLQEDLLALHYAAVEYAIMNNGVYPGALEVLVLPDANGVRYLEQAELPLDPWGRPYLYMPVTQGSEAPRIYSLGRDGQPGGAGPDADVDNMNVLERMRSDR